MSTDDLAPCPFCGGKADFEEAAGPLVDTKSWTVGCEERTDEGEVLCFGYQSLTTFATKREAAQAWNRRAHPPQERTEQEHEVLRTALVWRKSTHHWQGQEAADLASAVDRWEENCLQSPAEGTVRDPGAGLPEDVARVCNGLRASIAEGGGKLAEDCLDVVERLAKALAESPARAARRSPT